VNNNIYDLEVYPNIFTLHAREAGTENRWLFEISWRKNQIVELMEFFGMLNLNGLSMVGFNNQGYDYPVLHFIIENRLTVTAESIYEKSINIINTPWNNRFANIIWENNQHVSQIDLFKIHHFDNHAKSTSLKVLEFNMRMDSIEDLPFPPGAMLTSEEMDILIDYGNHDVDATHLFWEYSKPNLDFRKKLSKKYQRNVMNHNDTKIGKDYFINELEKHSPGCCYDNSSGKRKPRQTKRSIIHFKDILLPCIQFNHPEFQRVHRYFYDNSITNLKGDLPKLNAIVRGFQFDFGTGGLHGSISPCIVKSDDEYVIIDIDVTRSPAIIRVSR
jgi:hypothetical protein